MNAAVIVLMIIGIISIAFSYIFSEKLENRIEQEKAEEKVRADFEPTEEELKIIKEKVSNVVNDKAEDVIYDTENKLSKLSNEKTLALGDYAVTVCDEIEKNHKEVMFLYSMLNDKEAEIKELVKKVDASMHTKEVEVRNQEQATNVTRVNSNVSIDEKINSNQAAQLFKNVMNSENKEDSKDNNENRKDTIILDSITENMNAENKSKSALLVEGIDNIQNDNDNINSSKSNNEDNMDNNMDNNNEAILKMCQEGKEIIDIAKELGLGIGEVKLVVDLYQGMK